VVPSDDVGGGDQALVRSAAGVQEHDVRAEELVEILVGQHDQMGSACAAVDQGCDHVVGFPLRVFDPVVTSPSCGQHYAAWELFPQPGISAHVGAEHGAWEQPNSGAQP
jgi:hypothetical protein